MEKYYITTAIAYASAKPHFGNVYEIVLADAIARYKRLQGYDVFFQTGTDEHGQKIENNAKDNSLAPQAYVDNISSLIKDLFDQMNISYDKFMRTTDDYHKLQVQKIFKKLYDQGDIYKSEYNGKYCKYCESFFTSSQLVDGLCPDCGREVSDEKEEAYFLKLSKYQDKLEAYINENVSFIEPESRKNEMMNNFIIPGVQDLCVSRTTSKWGIPVDFDENHTVYVWIDALSNYITGIGYDVDGNSSDLYKKYWPADLHLIGKDILRFHTIYWPVILMALGEELPKQIFGHPWLLVGDGKMSKSKGNVLYSDELSDILGVDATRFIMLHEMPFGHDGKLTPELMVETVNTNLANVLGNLVNRTISMTNKYFDGTVSKNNKETEFDKSLISEVNNLKIKVEESMSSLRVADSIEEIINVLRKTNKYIDETCPWILAKDESKKEVLEIVLYNILESIRVCAILLSPFIPSTSEEILKSINVENVSYDDLVFGKVTTYKVVKEPKILFARLDEEETIKKITKEI